MRRTRLTKALTTTLAAALTLGGLVLIPGQMAGAEPAPAATALPPAPIYPIQPGPDFSMAVKVVAGTPEQWAWDSAPLEPTCTNQPDWFTIADGVITAAAPAGTAGQTFRFDCLLGETRSEGALSVAVQVVAEPEIVKDFTVLAPDPTHPKTGQLQVVGAGGNPVTWALTGNADLPDWVTIDQTTGLVTAAPGPDDAQGVFMAIATAYIYQGTAVVQVTAVGFDVRNVTYAPAPTNDPDTGWGIRLTAVAGVTTQYQLGSVSDSWYLNLNRWPYITWATLTRDGLLTLDPPLNAIDGTYQGSYDYYTGDTALADLKLFVTIDTPYDPDLPLIEFNPTTFNGYDYSAVFDLTVAPGQATRLQWPFKDWDVPYFTSTDPSPSWWTNEPATVGSKGIVTVEPPTALAGQLVTLTLSSGKACQPTVACPAMALWVTVRVRVLPVTGVVFYNQPGAILKGSTSQVNSWQADVGAPAGHSVSYDLVGGEDQVPSWVTIDQATGRVKATPTTVEPSGSYKVHVIALDPQGPAAATYTLEVRALEPVNLNGFNAITVEAGTYREFEALGIGNTYYLLPQVDPLDWVSFSYDQALFTVNPPAGLTGTYRVQGEGWSFGCCTTQILGAVDITVTAPQPPTLTQPLLQGIPKVGNTLAVSAAPTPADAQLSYQWFRGTKAVTARSGQAQYVVQAADAGQDLVVKVWATSAGGEVFKYSNHLVIDQPPTLTTAVLSGTGAVGTVLQVTAVYTPQDAQVTYQWYRGTSLIAGVTGPSYTPVASDATKDIVVKVTVSKAGETALVKYTNHVVVPGITSVVINGLPAVNRTIAAVVMYGPADGTLTYQWFRGTRAVTGALAHGVYTPVAADAGQDLVCKVSLVGPWGVIVKYSAHITVAAE
ncbi:MAG: putative Ig domain-containing protein [Bifidobacteriaceae bacterium]|jgi:hypothetical protein|nr:putative Ig domain-containing protein [Bifidobacteriaceae bacterium]